MYVTVISSDPEGKKLTELWEEEEHYYKKESISVTFFKREFVRAAVQTKVFFCFKKNETEFICSFTTQTGEYSRLYLEEE